MQEEMLTESVYFKESMDSPYQGAPLSMMLELICQRLQQGFQVYMGDSYEKDGRLTYRTTMGRNIHELSMDMSSDVDKTIDIRCFSRKSAEALVNIHYKCLIWNPHLEASQQQWETHAVEFGHGDPVSRNPWNYIDTVVVGESEYSILETARPLRLRFHVVPAQFVDFATCDEETAEREISKRNGSLQRLLESLTSKSVQPVGRADETAIKIKTVVDPSYMDSTVPEKNPNKIFGPRLTRDIKLQMIPKGADRVNPAIDRLEWVFLHYDRVVNLMNCCLALSIDWLVCGRAIDDYVQWLQRRAKAANLNLVQVPCRRDVKTFGHFDTFVSFPFQSAMEMHVVLRTLVSDRFQFFSEMLKQPPATPPSQYWLTHVTGAAIIQVDPRELAWFCNPFLGEEGKFRELVNTFRLFLEGELGEIVKREEEAERLREEQLLQERERALAEAAEREALQIEDEEQQTKSPGSAETETPPHSVS